MKLKNIRLWRFIFVIVLIFGFTELAFAESFAALKPSIKVWTDLNSARQKTLVHVRYELPPGMHQFQDSTFLTIGIIDNPNYSLANIHYPKPNALITGLAAWSDSIQIDAELVQKPNSQATADLTLKASWQICYDTGICLPPKSENIAFTIPANNNEAKIGFSDLIWYLLLAFLGGLILNIMPCVLPVLSLKLINLAQNYENDLRTRLFHGLATFVGILLSLTVLAGVLVALQAGGKMAGWGFQFQNAGYTIAISLIILVFSLSLWGVWSLPMPSFRRSVKLGRQSAGSKLGREFFSGFLVVVLATPCTAPFLGSALGFALTAPAWVIFLTFWSIGLGLSAPFLLIGLIPNLGKFIPKPGKWMSHLSELLGFALFGTFVWLVSVVYFQVSGTSFGIFLWVAFIVALSLRILSLVRQGSWRRIIKIVVSILVFAIFAASLGFLVSSLQSQNVDSKGQTIKKNLPAPWKEFDEQLIQSELAAGTSIFVDFTAEWCLTCKVNEAGVLADPKVLKAFADAKFTLIRGDYTNGDERIDRWLVKYGRAGVPFYLILRPDGTSLVLPEILAKSNLLSSLNP